MTPINNDTFDPSRAYAAQGDVFFDDGREIELLHFVFSHPSLHELRGSPQRVLEVIDEFARNHKYLMNVGENKGKIIADLIAQVKPKTMLELGGYVGYSTILFGDTMRKRGGTKYYSLERNPEFAAVSTLLVNLAGLDDTVKVVVGPSAESIERLHHSGSLQHIDLMFLDHYKPAYATDLKLCEHLRLIKKGSVLAADNVIKPGNPPYLEYVRSTVEEKRHMCGQSVVSSNSVSHFPDKTKNQYVKRQGMEILSTSLKGNPNLQYESKLIKSWEPSGVPDGVEITRCTGEL